MRVASCAGCGGNAVPLGYRHSPCCIWYRSLCAPHEVNRGVCVRLQYCSNPNLISWLPRCLPVRRRLSILKTAAESITKTNSRAPDTLKKFGVLIVGSTRFYFDANTFVTEPTKACAICLWMSGPARIYRCTISKSADYIAPYEACWTGSTREINLVS